jgi:trans-aconitate methyltransferase
VYRPVSGTGSRSFVAAERDAFIAAYKNKLNVAYPPRGNATLFPFKRLFVVARR